MFTTKTRRTVRICINTLTSVTLRKPKGSPDQNREYCSKEGKFFEHGVLPKQGKRTDIDQMKDLVQTGASLDEIWLAARSFQAFRMAERGLQFRELPKANPNKKVFWFWGPSGTGKTRTAVELYPDAWMSGGSLKWWDGYYGQKTVIIDDFREEFCSFAYLLRVLDIYPFRVEVKGSSILLEAEVIIITCPYPPSLVYSQVGEDVSQLLRRIYEIRKFQRDLTVGTEVGGNTSPSS